MASKNRCRLTARLRINDKLTEINNVERVHPFFSWGLMFKSKEKANALLFEFSSDVTSSITSLFCPPFVAIWLDANNKIVEYKIVSPNKLSIKPEKPFRKLIEVPVNQKYSNVVEFLLSEGKL